MLAPPSRKSLAALTGAINAVVPAATIGLTRKLDKTSASILYSYPYGLGEYVLAANDLPELLLPVGDHLRQSAVTVQPNAQSAIDWLLFAGGVQRIVSIYVAKSEPETCFWIGLSNPAALTNDQTKRIKNVVEASPGLSNTNISTGEAADRLRRIELAGELLPVLLRVLDVRGVFDRLSSVAQKALPHDLLMLRLLSDDLSKVTTFSRTGGGDDLDMELTLAYPAAVIRASTFDIVDDHAIHPVEQHNPPAKLGLRSSLRLLIRSEDQVIGGIAFMSFEPSKYTSADAVIARRLADYIALALSHYRLAQQFAEQARNNEALRAQTTNLELLDELLATLIDSGDIPDVFGRISALAQKVLTHDAALLMVRLPDGVNSRFYASSGYGPDVPETTEIPKELLQNPDWEHEIIDDLSFRGPRYARAMNRGFRSMLRVVIRFDGEFAGTLIFLSRALSGFKQDDILVARRMADRLSVTLVRDRELQASRRADEATERAAKLEARVRVLTEELDSRTGFRRVIGESDEWRHVLKQATQVASTEATVLLMGESGTGKEVVARFVHRASVHNGGPFVALNCAALPEQLLEAELFGYERGAFTGAMQSKPGQLEQAAGGTLFLDEVAEMSPSAQAKFLRVLQEREFQRLGGTRVIRTDARIVAATNRDLQRAIEQGLFREDLYYRLNVFAIRLPALRDRRNDILPLSEAFLMEIGRGIGRPPGGISREARRLLVEYHWPGNVRELRNILERAAILCDGGLITAEHLALTVAVAQPPPPAADVTVFAAAPPPAPAVAAQGSPARASDLQAIERGMIEQALQSARFNKSKAAKSLGLTRHQLYLRMRKYGFD